MLGGRHGCSLVGKAWSAEVSLRGGWGLLSHRDGLGCDSQAGKLVKSDNLKGPHDPLIFYLPQRGSQNPGSSQGFSSSCGSSGLLAGL